MNLKEIFLYYIKRKDSNILLIYSASTIDGLIGLIGIGILPVLLTQENELSGNLYFLKKIFNSVSSYLNIEQTHLLIIIFLTRLVLTTLINIASVKNAVKISNAVRFELLKDFLHYGTHNDEDNNSGDYINTIAVETEKIRICYTLLCALFQNLCFGLLFLSLAFMANSKALLIVLTIGLLSLILFKKINLKSRKLSICLNKLNANLQSGISQAIDSKVYLKATSRITYFLSNIKPTIKGIKKNSTYLESIAKLTKKLPEPIAALVITTGLIFYDQLGFKTKLEFILLSLFCYKAFSYILSALYNIQQITSYSGGVVAIFALQSKFNLSKKSFIQAESSEPHLLRKITIKSQNGHFVKIKAGEITTIFGKSGSGKTTLINEILGVQAQSNKEITYYSSKMSKINIYDLRSEIGYVPQKPLIFQGSLLENITFFTKSKIDFKKYQFAINSADLNQFRREKGDSYNLQENGRNISGGECQRIALAREIYKNPKLLILDEFTSALDKSTEVSLMSKIKKNLKHSIIIIISHSQNVCNLSDQLIDISLLNEETITEDKTKEENEHPSKQIPSTISPQLS